MTLQRKLNGTCLRKGSVNQRKKSSLKRKFYGIIMLMKVRVLTELINLVPASLLPELFPFMYGLFFNSVDSMKSNHPLFFTGVHLWNMSQLSSALKLLF